MEEKLLSPGEAAQLLGVSRQRLTQLRDKGQVTAKRVGRFWLYEQSNLERRKAELAQREAASGSDAGVVESGDTGGRELGLDNS